MICPKCHSDNPDTQSFCGDCGTQLSQPKDASVFTKTLETPFPQLSKGTSLANRYEIKGELGKGGMGEVYLAEDMNLKRQVAIKVLSQPYALDEERLARFEREARLLASLNHPNIATIHGLEKSGGQQFLVMELVKGETLRERISRGSLPVEEVLEICKQIAEGLESAHEKGIIHRDLKPANVKVTPEGKVKILDFGIAKAFQDQSDDSDPLKPPAMTGEMTQPGVILGTLAYMSPEQLRAKPLSPRSDVFSFGVILYEMLSGEHPFNRPSSAETINAILADSTPALKIEEGKVPDKLAQIIHKALEKAPEKRFGSAAEIAEELRAAERTLVQPRKVASPLVLGATAVATVIVVLAGLWLISKNRAAAPVAEIPEPISVLIADFDNQTGDGVFTGVLETATAIVLEDAAFVIPFKRDRALQSAETIRPDASILDEELARLVAQREGINIVVSGSIEEVNGKYIIQTTALDPVSGETIGDQQMEVSSREEVLVAIGKLAGSIRESLGDTDPDRIRMAAEESFTATSLEAAHSYVRAQDLLTAGKWQDAIQAFTELVEDYPEMGRAYSGIAVALANMGRREEAAEYYNLAMAYIDRMTEREKGRTRGTYYLMTRNYQKASEVYEQLVEAYPFDEAARINLVLGYFYGRQMDRTLVAARDAVEAFPHSAMAQANLALAAMYASDFEAAKTQAEVVLEAHPAYETAYVCLALSQLALSETEDAIENYRRLAGVSDWGASLAATGLADIAIYEGRLNDAAAILEEAVTSDLEGGNESAAANKLFTLANVELMRGRSDHAAAAARRATKVSQQEQVLFEAARAHLGTGRADEALALAAQLAERLAPEPQAYAELIRGEIALTNGEPRRAVTLFLEAKNILDTWIGQVDLGRAYLESEAFPEAHAEFEGALVRCGEAASVFLDDVPSYHYLPPVHYYLGRAQEGLGSSTAADSYRTFLEIKKDDDGDPRVTDARSRLARLQSR